MVVMFMYKAYIILNIIGVSPDAMAIYKMQLPMKFHFTLVILVLHGKCL